MYRVDISTRIFFIEVYRRNLSQKIYNRFYYDWLKDINDKKNTCAPFARIQKYIIISYDKTLQFTIIVLI